MKRNITIITSLLIAILSYCQVQAASFAYQGVLKDEVGQPLPGNNQTVSFKLYDTPAGSAFLWGRTYAVLLDDNGLFNIELSDANGSEIAGGTHPLLKDALSAAANGTLYLGLTVSGLGGEIQPRQKILSVPYAAMAADVTSASADFAAAGRITAAAANVTGTMEVGGKATLQTLVVSGTSDMTGKLTARGGIEMTGGEARIAGNLILSGQVDGNFNVAGKVQENSHDLLPKGVIVMWSGSATQIPAGWALCDGGSGRPDLRDRFIVGAGSGSSYNVGQTGGEDKHTLTAEEMPEHSHSTSFKTVGYAAAWNNSQEAVSGEGKDKNKNNGTLTKTTSSVGGGQPHENRPPFYALCFIIKL